MKLRLSVAFGLILGSALAGPVLAVEHEAPELPIARSDISEQPAALSGGPEQLNTQTDAVLAAVQDQLAQPFKKKSKYETAEHGALVAYYAESGKMLWVDENGLLPKARLVIKELTRAADYGLNPGDYDLPEEIVLSSSDTTPTARLAEFELKMSHAALAYARHARGGRKAPQEIRYSLDPTLDLPVPSEMMERMAVLDDPAPYLRDFNPKHPQFEALRQVLLKMRGGPTTEEKRIVIPKGPTLRPGVTHEQIVLLRKRLKVPVPMKDGVPLFKAGVYGSELEMAVKAFQKKRGLSAEGLVGPQTRRALNGGKAPKYRMKTILANMERWRWIPNNLDKLNVRVNIPEFRYRVYDGEEVVTDARVIVGRPRNQTPVFSDSMKFLVFKPYWNVPNGIKRDKIIPLIQQDRGGGWFRSSSRPRVLEQQNMFVSYKGKNIDASKVNWNKVNISQYRFYQMPGPNNAMGAVKFKFPNKHVVYLHDTPTRNLFDKTVRAYSYGCVRVRNPRKLAEILLTRVNPGWTAGRVAAAFKGKPNQRVNLKTPVPVNITYFTARVEKSGKVTYFADIYGHDARMAKALNL